MKSKKLLTLLSFLLILGLALAACGGETAEEPAEEPTEEPTEEPMEEPTEEPMEEEAAEGEMADIVDTAVAASCHRYRDKRTTFACKRGTCISGRRRAAQLAGERGQRWAQPSR